MVFSCRPAPRGEAFQDLDRRSAGNNKLAALALRPSSRGIRAVGRRRGNGQECRYRSLFLSGFAGFTEGAGAAPLRGVAQPGRWMKRPG